MSCPTGRIDRRKPKDWRKKDRAWYWSDIRSESSPTLNRCLRETIQSRFRDTFWSCLPGIKSWSYPIWKRTQYFTFCWKEVLKNGTRAPHGWRWIKWTVSFTCQWPCCLYYGPSPKMTRWLRRYSPWGTWGYCLENLKESILPVSSMLIPVRVRFYPKISNSNSSSTDRKKRYKTDVEYIYAPTAGADSLNYLNLHRPRVTRRFIMLEYYCVFDCKMRK